MAQSQAVADVVANLRRQIEERTGVPLKTASSEADKFLQQVEDKAKVVSFPKPEPVTEEEPEPSAKVSPMVLAELERLRAENEALRKRGAKGLSLKVSDKGAVSVYGMGRFPTTLYKEQWLKVLDMADEIRAFIKENDAKLKAKE